MEKTATEILEYAREKYQNDARLRSYVDAAVNEAMKHFDHIESEVGKRDLQHAAVLAATTVQRMTIDGDALLKQMEFERDAARKLAHSAAMANPNKLYVADPPSADD